ncbi:MAG: aminodeoxychorismate/anthranilate synthase component II [Saprospiraceae bacterium]|nr:aminodeoxychorismate/anthranilate synthase component II [Saprospiraceae bacterium]
MQHLLLLDNYDSFTYNLVHLLREIGGCEITVRRNDQISLEDVAAFDKILLSPGPGIPEEAGILLPLIKTYFAKKPLLGVCLGHQAIAQACGANLINLNQVYHGVASEMALSATPGFLFRDIPASFLAGRYHSWAVESGSLPDDFVITATDALGAIMAFQHREFQVAGVQFHPESIMTEHGKKMLENFINL